MAIIQHQSAGNGASDTGCVMGGAESECNSCCSQVEVAEGYCVFQRAGEVKCAVKTACFLHFQINLKDK